MPVQRQFTFYPRTPCGWINIRDHMYKNTIHQNIIMHYLEFIFLNCTVVMPPTLPLTFRCLSKFQFPVTWWWKIDLLMSSCIIHLPFYLLLKKTVGILINYRLGCNNSHIFLHVHNYHNWTHIVTFQQFPIKVKISQLNGTTDFAFSTTKLNTR